MSKARSKTVVFPRYSLEQCEKWLSKLPPARPLKREKLLETIGYTNPTSGPAGSAMGALSMFGLIRREQNLYELSPFGRLLRNPVSDIQARAIRTLAFLLPERFRDFYVELKDDEIETNGYVERIFSQKYTVTDQVASRFERAFLDSGVHAEVILESSENQRKVQNIDDSIISLGIDLSSFTEITENVLCVISNAESCKVLFKQTTRPQEAIVDVLEEKPSTTTHETPREPDASQAEGMMNLQKGNHELIQIETDDGLYVVEKKELAAFVYQRGKKVDRMIQKL